MDDVCRGCGRHHCGSFCTTCVWAEKARGRAWAEGAAEVLMPMLERLAKPPVYNIINDNTARPDLKSFADTLEKKL